MNDQILVNQPYLLEKFPGKGGWTFARIPEILPDPHAHFGWVRVNGSIDGFEIEHYHLMPMGNGQLFLPVKAEIRKVIRKSAGDWVRVILYKDDLPVIIPEDLLECFDDMPGSLKVFKQLSEAEQIAHIKKIYSAKTDLIKAERINHLILTLIK